LCASGASPDQQQVRHLRNPVRLSAVVGTCAPLAYRLTNNKFHKVKIFTPCYNYASSFDEKFRNKAMIEVKLVEFL
jgi:hypothetical protein